MIYSDAFRAILSAGVGAALLYMLVKHIRAGRTGIFPDRDGAIRRSDDPRRYRLQLRFDAAMAVVAAIWIALLWATPPDGSRPLSTTVTVIALMALSLTRRWMTDPGARPLGRLAREEPAAGMTVAVMALMGVVLILQALDLWSQ
jgi:hypothetical protein